MRKGKSKSGRGKTGHWTQNQKLQVVSTWLMLGNMAETAVATGVPLPTIKSWRYSDWFKEAALQLQQEDLEKTSASMKKLVTRALNAVEDRLELGDAYFNQKTGKIVRIPVKAQVALKISTELLTKQQALMANPQKEQVEKTIDDRLLKLSEEFAKFASKRFNSPASDPAIDVVAKEVPTVDQA